MEYVLAIVNHGSFSAAAKHCFISQPSLSIQIRNLEDELGVVIFDRGSKPIIPTDSGLLIVEQARNAVTEFYSIKDVADNIKGMTSGHLRLGVIPTVSPYLMPRFIPEFIRICPTVDLEIRDMFPEDVVDALDRDLIDVAILSGGDLPAQFNEKKLFIDKIYAYVSTRNKLYGQEVLFQEDVDRNIDKLLFMSGGICLRSHRLKLTEAAKKADVSYRFTSSTVETLMHTVDEIGAFTMIPGMAVDYIPAEKRKQVKVFAQTDAYRTITMAVGRTCVKKALITAVYRSALAAERKSSQNTSLR